MVYVLNIDGQPLMPTDRHGKVKHLLKSGKAKVVKRCPFTIQLLYNSTNYIQEITLGVDAGSKHIGVSATTKDKELFKEYFIFGRRASGFFDIRALDGTKVNKGSLSYKKIQLIEKPKHYLVERRAVPLHT